MTKTLRSLAAVGWITLATGMALGIALVPAVAEEPEPAPPAEAPSDLCRGDLQVCTAGGQAPWCCPVQSHGAYLCCGAVEGVCHACDVEELRDEIPPVTELPTPSDLPRAD